MRKIGLTRKTLHNVQIFQIFEVHKLDFFPMVGAIGESWSNLIILVVHKNKFKSFHKSNLRDLIYAKSSTNKI